MTVTKGHDYELAQECSEESTIQRVTVDKTVIRRFRCGGKKTMKFFTMGYDELERQIKENGIPSPYERYTRHLESLKDVLSAEVLALAKIQGIDDGLIVRVTFDHANALLTLILRCGNFRMGYYDLILTYMGAKLLPRDERLLAHAARTTRDYSRHIFDIDFHELDWIEGGIEHRLLFYNQVWCTIRCRALDWKTVSRPNQKLPRSTNRFPGARHAPSPDRQRFAGWIKQRNR